MLELNKIHCGDCIETLKKIESNSVDSIVTDPPYELGFMGKKWDNTGIANNVEMWQECLRVLKPGGHLLAFSGTRTYHRMASAIEDAGFDIRDQIAWCYGQGFPKSLNISLQIKKKYNIGLCTCNVFEPMIQLGYENNNNKRDNISDGDNDRLGVGEQIQHQGTDNNEMEKQTKDTNLSQNNSFRKKSELCELSEDNKKKEQGFEKVGESVLQSGVCKSISKDEGLGNTTLRSGLEENQATSEREGQGMSNMQNETRNGVASSSLDTTQNGRKELNGELSGSLSQLPQQDRENNRKRVEEIKNDCNTEEWNNLSRFICSKCYCLKKDIGGTALKPSIEPICVARKPLSEKTVAENCLKWGTGGLNIDKCRVPTTEDISGISSSSSIWSADGTAKNVKSDGRELGGRFPANLIHDNSEEVRECFPETKTGAVKNTVDNGANQPINLGGRLTKERPSDSGNASRFFKSIIYQAKASKSERNMGCEGLEEKQTIGGGGGIGDYLEDVNAASGKYGSEKAPSKNYHPTVKPVKLMEYLITMVTPKNGIVLDPFAGSGTTGVACKNLNRNYILIEKEPEYCKIAEARINK